MNEALQKLYDLCFAIWDRDYEQVERLLNDESCPVNLYFPRFQKLPIQYALSTLDERMIHLFLDCPRIDWAAVNALNFNELDKYGIEYDKRLKTKNPQPSKCEVFECLKYGFGLFYDFEDYFPDEAAQIYDMTFAAFEQTEPAEELDKLVSQAIKSEIAFPKALKYCRNINMRLENGRTLLHDYDLALWNLIEPVLALGADVNAKDDYGKTPLMLNMRRDNVEIVRLLVEKGADLEAVDLEGRTVFEYSFPAFEILPHDYDFANSCFFRAGFEVSENCFKNILKIPVRANIVNFLLERYPLYLQVFQADFANNLGSIWDADKCILFAQLKPEDGLSFLKRFVELHDSSLWLFKYHPFLPDLIKKNVDELVYLAVKCSHKETIEGLHDFYYANTDGIRLTLEDSFPLFERFVGLNGSSLSDSEENLLPLEIPREKANEFLHWAVKTGCNTTVEKFLHGYKADPNSLIDNVPPLFKTGDGDIISILLKAGADPNFLVDGCKFFERDDFVVTEWTNDWFKIFSDQGLDLFEPIPKTGRSFFECVTEDGLRIVECYLDGPMKMTPTLLSNILSEEPDLHASMDDEGNTLLHYTYSRPVGICKRIPAFEYVKTKNNAGFTPLDLAVRSESFMDQILYHQLRINSVEELRLVEKAYDEAFGSGSFDSQVLDEVGAELFLELICRDVVSFCEYFIREKKISPERLSFYVDSHLTPFFPEMCDYGFHPLDVYLFQRSRSNIDRVYDAQLERRDDCYNVLFEYDINLEERERIPIELLAREKMQAFLKTNTEALRKLNRYFFRLCYDKEEVNALIELGFDPRNSPDSTVFDFRIRDWNNPEMWAVLRDRLGMTAKDFDNITTVLFDSVREMIQYDTDLKRIFRQIFCPIDRFAQAFAEISLDDIVGDKEACSICRDAFAFDDNVLKLPCNHLFHFDCAKEYFNNQDFCPYCRSPSPLQ